MTKVEGSCLCGSIRYEVEGEPPIRPQARIFWDSRAEWSCSGDGLPKHAEYPR